MAGSKVDECFICMKLISIEGQGVGTCQTFATLASRYLQLHSTSSRSTKTLNSAEWKNAFNSAKGQACSVCAPGLEAFCQMYDIWFTLQLEMDRLLQEITKRVGNSAHTNDGQESSRAKGAPNKYTREFRKELVKKVANKTWTGFPQLRLSRKAERKKIAKVLGTPQYSSDRLSSGSKGNVCDICDKSFSTPGNLITHQIVHSDKRLFQCARCLKSFKQKGHLDAHRKTHLAIKPFKCDICKKQFTSKHILAKHHELIHVQGGTRGRKRGSRRPKIKPELPARLADHKFMSLGSGNKRNMNGLKSGSVLSISSEIEISATNFMTQDFEGKCVKLERISPVDPLFSDDY